MWAVGSTEYCHCFIRSHSSDDQCLAPVKGGNYGQDRWRIGLPGSGGEQACQNHGGEQACQDQGCQDQACQDQGGLSNKQVADEVELQEGGSGSASYYWLPPRGML